jgi:hypothetical protein
MVKWLSADPHLIRIHDLLNGGVLNRTFEPNAATVQSASAANTLTGGAACTGSWRARQTSSPIHWWHGNNHQDFLNQLTVTENTNSKLVRPSTRMNRFT